MVQAVILSAEGQDTGQTPTVVREAATRPARGANGKGKAPEAGTCPACSRRPPRLSSARGRGVRQHSGDAGQGRTLGPDSERLRGGERMGNRAECFEEYSLHFVRVRTCL